MTDKTTDEQRCSIKSKEELQNIQKQMRQLGHLTKATNKMWLRDWKTKKRFYFFGFHLSRQGCWETLKASGVVNINYLAVQRIVQLNEDGHAIKAWQVGIGPLLINFGIWKLNNDR